jgi:hypothetical protein
MLSNVTGIDTNYPLCFLGAVKKVKRQIVSIEEKQS